jgi:hypothetical protein
MSPSEESDELTSASNAIVDMVQDGKLDEAEQAARDFLVRFPEVHDGYDRLGMVYEARGDQKQAAHYYRQVIDFVRTHPDQYEPAFETTFQRLVRHRPVRPVKAKMHEPAREDIGHPDGVHGRHVVCLLECVAYLPVDAERGTVMAQRHHRGKRIGIEVVRKTTEVLADSFCGRRRRVDEDKAVPKLHRIGFQAMVLFIDSREPVRLRYAAQPAIERVRPAVEPAKKRFRVAVAVLANHFVVTVAADIIERANLPVRAANDENGGPEQRNLLDEKVPGLRNFGLMTGQQPRVVE